MPATVPSDPALLPVKAQPTVEILPPRGGMQVVCPNHPNVTFRAGGFCEECYHEETMGRVKALDEGFAAVLTEGIQRLSEVLADPVDMNGDLDKLKVTLKPKLAALQMLQRRFNRPERIDVNHKVQQVSIVGSPVDFVAAAKAQAGQESK